LEFELKLGGRFDVGRILGDAGYRTEALTLWFVEVPNAFGAQIGVDLVNVFAHEDGLVWTDRFAHIAIDAVFGDVQRHGARL
jgi:hypothetical protein